MIDLQELEARVAAYAAWRVPSLAGGRAVIAVSGGGDSIVTAALLCETGVVRADASVVAHFDHRLRGEDAAACDRAAVEALCAQYGLRLVVGAWAAPRAGEAAAREARYRFLATVARDAGIDVVVTGHTSDDQAETVVMHALRGAGLHGLRGMAAEGVHSSEFDGVHLNFHVTRPMLCVSRAETRAYCDARGLAYVDDATNQDLSLTRNRVRLEVLPRMESVAPGARAALLRLADDAREGVAALEAIAATAIDTSGDENDGIVMSRAALRALPRAVAPYAWRLVIERLLGDAREFDRRHYALMACAAEAATGTLFELPRGVRVTVDADAIVVSIGALPAAAIDVSVEHEAPFTGVVGAWWISVIAGGGGLGAGCGLESPRHGEELSAGTPHESGDAWVPIVSPELERQRRGNEWSAAGDQSPANHQSPINNRQTCEALVLPAGAVVRGRRPGDRVQPLGMRGHKKLQDYYVDRKVPRRERDAAPVIACGREVLWTPFGALASVDGGRPYTICSQRVSTSNV